MSKKTTTFILLILIIASFFRFANLTSIPPGLYPDEAMNGNNALFALENNDFRVYYPENNGREGLFINIQALFLKFFLSFSNYPQAWMLRIVSAIFGTLTVLGVFLLIKTVFNSQIALFSSFFLAISFWHVNFSRIGFRAILVPFLLSWSLYWLIKAFQNKKMGSAIFSGIFFGLGFYTYIAFRVAPIIILFILIYNFIHFRRQKELKTFLKIILIWFLFFIITILPIALYFLHNPQDFMGRATQVSIFEKPNPLWEFIKSFVKTLLMFNFVGDCNFRHNFSCKPELDFIAGAFFLIGFYLIIKKVIKKQFDFASLFLIVWFLVMAMPVSFTYEGVPHALRSIGLIPCVFAFVGIGASKIYQLTKQNFSSKTGRYLILAFLFISLAINYNLYFLKWANNQKTYYAFNANYYALGNYLNQLPKEQLKYILVNANGVLVNNIPMPAQTVMFVTNTYSPQNQQKRNIFYLLPSDLDKLNNSQSFILIPLEKDEKTKNLLLQKFSNLIFEENKNFWIFKSI